MGIGISFCFPLSFRTSRSRRKPCSTQIKAGSFRQLISSHSALNVYSEGHSRPRQSMYNPFQLLERELRVSQDRGPKEVHLHISTNPHIPLLTHQNRLKLALTGLCPAIRQARLEPRAPTFPTTSICSARILGVSMNDQSQNHTLG